jgi:hypothetical protein
MIKMRPYPHRLSTRDSSHQARADRTTIWLLLLVVAALIIALTFSDADGCVFDSLLQL